MKPCIMGALRGTTLAAWPWTMGKRRPGVGLLACEPQRRAQLASPGVGLLV